MSDRDIEQYFLDIAQVVSTRSTCKRKQVGAVIVRDKCILATGYNGSVRGAPHCTDDECLMEDGHCINTVHAELNAIIQAAKHGTSIDGAIMYVTINPCLSCFKAIANAGIKVIIHRDLYGAVDYSKLRVPAYARPQMFHTPRDVVK